MISTSRSSGGRCFAVILVAFSLLLGASRAAMAIEHYGYALVDPASGEVRGYNSRGGKIEVTRYDRAAGLSVVTFRGLADSRFGGHVQVTAAGFNEGFAYCKIRSWESLGADVRITVACYDMRTRLPMQQGHKYSVLYLAQTEPAVGGTRDPVYLWTASATDPIGIPDRYAIQDPARPHNVFRLGPGRYRVQLTDPPSFLAPPIVLVTAYGPDNRSCQLETPVGAIGIIFVVVLCSGDTTFEDSQFTLLFLSRDLRDLPAARAMVTNQPTRDGGSFLTNGGSVTVDRDWVTLTPDLPHEDRDQNAVFMTAIDGTQTARCRPYTWQHSLNAAGAPQMRIQQQCFDLTGRETGTSYNMLVLGPPAYTPIIAGPVVSPTPAATTRCGVPEGSPAPDPTIERYFVPRGDYPANANPGWHENAMGLAHDNSNWYVTQYRPSTVWKIRPDRLDRARCDFDGVECTTSARWPLPNAALAPLGDPAVYYHGSAPARAGTPFLLVPIRTASDRTNPGGSYVVVLTGRLDYVTAIRLPEIDYITWVAVDGKGCLYTSQFGNTEAREPEVRELFRYAVDWNAISRRETVAPRPPERIPLRAGFHNVRGGEIAPSGLTLYLVADGIHAIDLRDGSIIRSSTNGGGSCFDFRFVPGEGERPSGITIWDYDFRDPRITGQLHVILRDDDTSADEIRLKHYTAGPSCR